MCYNIGKKTKGDSGMEETTLKQKIKGIKKGTFITIEYRSETAKNGHVIEKITKGVYRIGICYSHLKTQANKITQGLPFGEWEKGFENYIIRHTPKPKKGEIPHQEIYLRVYTVDRNKPKIKYICDGKETSKEWLLENNLITIKPHTDLFIVPIKNVIKIG